MQIAGKINKLAPGLYQTEAQRSGRRVGLEKEKGENVTKFSPRLAETSLPEFLLTRFTKDFCL